MSLRLYLDECAFSKRLRDSLRRDGHEVWSPFDRGLVGASDEAQFAYAKVNRLVLITLNPRDFESIHNGDSSHAGILAVYQDDDTRDMTYDDIVHAIANVERSGVAIEGHFHVLNAWRY